MNPRSAGAGVESTPDRRKAPWQSAPGGAWSSGDSVKRPPIWPSGPFKASQTVLRPLVPISWFHPVGIRRVLARLVPRLPDVSRCLFLTFTLDQNLFADPSTGFEYARQKLRRVFYRLRHGLRWEGKLYLIKEPYAVKVEFGGNEWVHFHAIFLTRRFLPASLVAHLWSLGRTNIERIGKNDFSYLLKYVTKDGDFPEWVKSRKRLRIFQGSRGFLKPIETKPRAKTNKEPEKRASSTIGERLERQKRTAVIQSGDRFSHIPLSAPYDELHGRNILGAAKEGRYLGGAHYQIRDTKDLLQWIS